MTARLAVLASGILGTRVGLPQADAFRGETESAAGLATLGTHFPAGSAAPSASETAPSARSCDPSEAWAAPASTCAAPS